MNSRYALSSSQNLKYLNLSDKGEIPVLLGKASCQCSGEMQLEPICKPGGGGDVEIWR